MWDVGRERKVSVELVYLRANVRHDEVICSDCTILVNICSLILSPGSFAVISLNILYMVSWMISAGSRYSWHLNLWGESKIWSREVEYTRDCWCLKPPSVSFELLLDMGWQWHWTVIYRKGYKLRLICKSEYCSQRESVILQFCKKFTSRYSS